MKRSANARTSLLPKLGDPIRYRNASDAERMNAVMPSTGGISLDANAELRVGYLHHHPIPSQLDRNSYLRLSSYLYFPHSFLSGYEGVKSMRG